MVRLALVLGPLASIYKLPEFQRRYKVRFGFRLCENYFLKPKVVNTSNFERINSQLVEKAMQLLSFTKLVVGNILIIRIEVAQVRLGLIRAGDIIVKKSNC